MGATGVDFSAIREANSLMSHLPPDTNLRKVGADTWRGRCPIGDHAQGAFSVRRDRDGSERFNCFACGTRGDVIDLVAALDGITTKEAARRLGAGIRHATPDERLTKMADAWAARRPALGLLTCDWCWESLAVGDWAAVAAARSAGWRLSASGRVAVCPGHNGEPQQTGPREVVIASGSWEQDLALAHALLDGGRDRPG